MDLLKILQAFENGEKIQKRLKKEGEEWEDIEPNHLWSIADFEYRIKPDREIYPYTKKELIAKIAYLGSIEVEKDEHIYFITDIWEDYVEIERGLEVCKITLKDLAEGYIWSNERAPCGWDSKEYEVVYEPLIDRGIQYGTERVVRRKQK